MDHLDYYEKALLTTLKSAFKQSLVPIEIKGEHYEMNTIESIRDASNSEICEYPLVLMHGFGGGIGIYVKNIDTLAERFKLYAFDTLGSGKSSRPRFPTEPEDVENFLVDSIEAWRKSMNLDKMILLGHSFGGYQAACYAIKYPHHIKHLILADPWGFPVKPEVFPYRVPLWLKLVSGVLRPFPPFAVLRLVFAVVGVCVCVYLFVFVYSSLTLQRAGAAGATGDPALSPGPWAQVCGSCR